MKLFAYLLNVGWLMFFVVLLIDEGLPSDDMLLPFFLMVITILVNIAALYTRMRSNQGWVSLFFERKALEERKRIEILNEKK